MNVHSYARNFNLNRKCGKECVKTQNFDFLKNKTVNFFIIPNALQSIRLFSRNNSSNVPSIFLFSIEVPFGQKLCNVHFFYIFEKL